MSYFRSASQQKRAFLFVDDRIPRTFRDNNLKYEDANYQKVTYGAQILCSAQRMSLI